MKSFAIRLALIGTLLCGCGPMRAYGPVPEKLTTTAQVPGLSHIRTFGDVPDEDYRQSLIASIGQENRYYAAHPELVRPTTVDMLAISGGGADGAFGAGLLNGWTEAQDRPQFKIVSGISTGALIAPFAFLGPKYDAVLKAAYTQTDTDNIFNFKGLLAVFTGPSLADTYPLAKMIAKIIDEKVLQEVAAEHAKGRRLLIGTVNLECQRPVIWDMGAIASSGHPQALPLFRRVMLASASIPGAFPPVFIDVEAAGKKYDEMHVDGSTIAQVFLWGMVTNERDFSRKLSAESRHRHRPLRIYVVMNAALHPQYQQINPYFLPIVSRAIDTLIMAQAIGDIYRIYLRCQEEKMKFFLADIPADFTDQPKEAFDRAYMNKLYKIGYEMAYKGYPWQTLPPYMRQSRFHTPTASTMPTSAPSQ